MTLFEFCDKAKVSATNIAHWVKEDDERLEAEERYEKASPEERLRLQLTKPPKPYTKTHAKAFRKVKLTDEMVLELRKTIFMTRGPAAQRDGKKQHPLYKANPEWQDSGHRTFLRLPELTGRIWLHFKEHFAAEEKAGRKVTLNQLYHRVRRWCKRHDIVYRISTTKSIPPSVAIQGGACLFS